MLTFAKEGVFCENGRNSKKRENYINDAPYNLFVFLYLIYFAHINFKHIFFKYWKVFGSFLGRGVKKYVFSSISAYAKC